MSPEELIANFPKLYHVAHVDSWPQIERHGLLSTKALLDKFEIRGRAKARLLKAHRPDSVEIEHPKYGSAVVRDQKPMSERALLKCLEDMTPKEWYATLNSRVFLWPTRDRLLNFLNARAYRDKIHCVLTVDTERLLSGYEGKIRLSPINSGSTVYNPAPRGSTTFLPLKKYDFESWRRKRSRKLAIAEVAVDHGIESIKAVALLARKMKRSGVIETLWAG